MGPTWVRTISSKLTLVATDFFLPKPCYRPNFFNVCVVPPKKKNCLPPKNEISARAVFGTLHTRYSHYLHTGIIRLLLTLLLNQKFQVPKMQLLSLFWGSWNWDSGSPFFSRFARSQCAFCRSLLKRKPRKRWGENS